jgi:aminoglycoside phosphotransferase (APT) family kinase protein
MSSTGGWAQEHGLDATWQRAFARVEELVGGRVVDARRQDRWRPAWFLDVETGDGVVAVYFRGDRGEADHGVYPLEHEMGVLQVLEDHGVPVPHVFGFCDDPRGIVMATAPGHANLATEADPELRRSVLEDYVRILAGIHRLPLDAFQRLGLHRPRNASEIGLGDLPRWEKSYRARKSRPEPLIEFVLRWLHRNPPHHRARATFVAGDSGQFLFEGGRVTALIDLELAYLGDPLADLAGMRCRDLSEPLGDLSQAFARYAEETGEPLDLPALHFHTARFGICTPMAVAALCASPPPGLNLAQYLGWYHVYGRVPLEAIAEREGIGLEPIAMPVDKDATPNAVGFDTLVGLLEAGEGGERSYAMDTALRVAAWLREVDRHGERLAEQDLEEAGALLGRSLTDATEADAALEVLVAEAEPARDGELLRYFHRRTQRQEVLLRPALRELEGARLQPIRG